MKNLVHKVFSSEFDESNYKELVLNLFNRFDFSKRHTLKHQFNEDEKQKLIDFLYLGTFEDSQNKSLDVLSVELKSGSKVERARSLQRNLIGKYLKNNLKDSALVAFYSKDNPDWRLSFVKMDYRLDEKGVKTEIGTPPKRYSFLVGKTEPSHTAQKQLLPLLDDSKVPSIEDIEKAFSIEPLTDEFYKTYKAYFKEIQHVITEGKPDERSHAFALQLLSRMMFIYFIQRLYHGEDSNKKYWLNNDRRYLKNLFERYKKTGMKDKFHGLYLNSLFFHSFNRRFGFQNFDIPSDIKAEFALMPYLNGGLFREDEEIDRHGFNIPDSLFEELFENLLDRFNFTVREDTTLDIEVAVDPVMLGQVYESLVNEEERGKSGIFYTQPVELDFMCRMALIEYLNGKLPVKKENIIRLVIGIAGGEDLPYLEPSVLSQLRDLIEDIAVVDPACGSGAFLVTMLNILLELHLYIAAQRGYEPNTYELKKRIIARNLYGVDIKKWAVHIAELRLWLSLIVETEGIFIDLYTKPLLPNLTFRVRQGDSLVEEIGGVPFLLRKDVARFGRLIKKDLEDIRQLKLAHYNNEDGRGPSKEIIFQKEQALISKIIDNKIYSLRKDFDAKYPAPKKMKQEELFSLSPEQIALIAEEDRTLILARQKAMDSLNKEIDYLEKIKIEFSKGTNKDFFLWELDFPEVFEKGGFDIVIGNPPYVRQEAIAPSNLKPDDVTPEIKKSYKDKLVRSIKNLYGNSLTIDKKSDLYVYFYFHGIGLLRTEGVFCFITSNSWLDVGYGAELQEFLLNNVEIKGIYDNHARRSFSQADVNTIISVFKLSERKEELLQHHAKFIAFKKPFEDVINTQNLLKVENADSVTTTNDFRVYPVKQETLLEEGWEQPDEEAEESAVRSQKSEDKNSPLSRGVRGVSKRGFSLLQDKFLTGKYEGNKWGGKYLRAPDIFFTILEKRKGKLVRLGDIAEVRFGIKTGANEFFYLTPLTSPLIKGGHRGVLKVCNGAGWEGEIEEEFLKPVIKSPRECKSILIKPEDLKFKIFMCHKAKGFI